MAITLNGTTGITSPGLDVDNPTLFVDSSQNRVGIGVDNPGAKLSVGATAPASNSTRDVIMTTVDTKSAGIVYTGSAYAYAGVGANEVWWYNNSNVSGVSIGTDGSGPIKFIVTNEKLRITSSGNVGIGTTNPLATLHTSTTSASARQLLARFDNLGQQTFYIEGQWGSNDIGSSNGTILYSGGTIALRGSTSGNSHLTVLNNGNVGIGTLNPTNKLHVQGNLLVKSGDLTVDTGVVTLFSGGSAPVVEQNGSMYFAMRGKVIQSNSNATASELFTLGGLWNAGAMVKVIVRGAHAISAVMYEDTFTAWLYYVAGTYQNSGIGPTTTQNIINTHTMGALSWANVSGGAPILRYTQGNNGYIAESLDVVVVCRDGCNVTWNRNYVVFG